MPDQFVDPILAGALRAWAEDADLRNRAIVADDRPRCACGDLLTIADRGATCRQCVLERRQTGGIR